MPSSHVKSDSAPQMHNSTPLPAIDTVPASPTSESQSAAPLRSSPPPPHRGYSLAVPSGTAGGPLLPTHHGTAGGLHHAASRDSIGGRAASDAGSARTWATHASEAPPLNFRDSVQIYQIVCNRRAVFDGLLWSVPSTSFAAQAFLFQTALAGDSAQSARIISMALSILITVLTLQLFTRQLQAEAADHAWLEAWEKRHQVHKNDCAHGETWNEYRSVPPKRARYFKFLASIRGFTLWSNGMLIIGLVALGVLVTSATVPTAFQNCQN